jgi:hypothetical protein
MDVYKIYFLTMKTFFFFFVVDIDYLEKFTVIDSINSIT